LRGQDWRLTAAIATPERDYQIKSPTNPFSRKLVGRRGCACGFVGGSAMRMPVKVSRVCAQEEAIGGRARVCKIQCVAPTASNAQKFHNQACSKTPTAISSP
jgi:hypothetical protein